MAKFKLWHSMDEEPMMGIGLVLVNKELDMWEASFIGGHRFQLIRKYGELPDNTYSKELFIGWCYRKDLFDRTNFDDIYGRS